MVKQHELSDALLLTPVVETGGMTDVRNSFLFDLDTVVHPPTSSSKYDLAICNTEATLLLTKWK
jgi:hypothetical protein